MQHLQPNTTLQGGKYRIERVLGQGGFGITYLAIQTSLNRYVAIKELFVGGSGQAINERRGNQVVVTNSVNQQSFNQQKAKFKKEALRLANLNHPNLVKVHEFFEENGTAYYVMDYIDGESLRTKLNREGKLSERLVLKYINQILPALDAAHKQNIWHLDIKPENIMVDRYGHVYLIDFGASKHIERTGTLTTSLALAYTPGYCAPELTDLLNESEEGFAEAMREIGPWTDIYSLGATMYNLLTDSIPPSSKRIERNGRNAFSFPSDVSSSTKELIVWMMMPNREGRLQVIRDIHKRQNQVREDDERTKIERKTGNSFDKWAVCGKFYDDRARVQDYNGKWGVIDRLGKVVVSCRWAYCGNFRDGMARVQSDNGKWGFIDKKGNLVIPCIWSDSNDFYDGEALVKNDKGKWGPINKTGNIVTKLVYNDEVGDFVEETPNPLKEQSQQIYKNEDDCESTILEGNQRTKRTNPPHTQSYVTSPVKKSYTIEGNSNYMIGWILGIVAIAFISFLLFFNNEDRSQDETPKSGHTISSDGTIMFNISDDVHFNMKYVKAGTFYMGATSEISQFNKDEKPVHEVTLTSDFYIGETEVTQALWTKIMGNNPSPYHKKGDNLPVNSVSWNDCQIFIRKLNSITGYTFRLPTEAEWEYAARGGIQSRHYMYSGSNNWGNVAWCGDNTQDAPGSLQTVKTLSPNELGIYDMSGNVSEWCQDWYGTYPSEKMTDPTGPASGDRRICRGGDIGLMPIGCTVSCRGYRLSPNEHDPLVGIRLAASK